MNQIRPQKFFYQSAFSLIELLIVIAIIGVLIGILLPVLGMSRGSARRLLCMNNMRNLGIGAHGYATNNDGILPWEGYAEGDRAIRHLGGWSDSTQWFNACLSYSGMESYDSRQRRDMAGSDALPRDGQDYIFVCPESQPAMGNTLKGDLVTDGYFMLFGKEDNGTISRRKTFWSYGFNTQLDGGVEDRHENDRPTITAASIPQPSATVFLIEKIMRYDEITPRYTSNVGQSEVSSKEFTTRHEAGGMLLFLDNRVEQFKRSDVRDFPGYTNDYNQPGYVVWNPAGRSL